MPDNNGEGQGAGSTDGSASFRHPGAGLPAGGARTRAERLAEALDARIRSGGLAAGDPVGTL
ncbi:hypothetical protein, partial [Streptomyces sp.]|uniref:hypothetical protein n=1 Tax=Streptomyces sp. TaxID=1931 RepID=UPI0028126FB1